MKVGAGLPPRAAATRGAAMIEFVLVWPVALLLVLGCVELALWDAESVTARSAALAGARAASVVGSDPNLAVGVALRVLAPSLVGVRPAAWCPGQPGRAPDVWVCAVDLGATVQVEIGGSVPSLVPLLPGGRFPIRARAVVRKEVFM